ncbi:MAG: hypothetical protein AAF802_28965 [Planctomycetota bacterium]
MRKLFSRYAVLAAIAASLAIALPAEAKYDFDALLADVNSGQDPAEPVARDLAGDATTPAIIMPTNPGAEELPVPPVPATQPAATVPSAPPAAPHHAQAVPAAVNPGMPMHVSAAPCTDGCSDLGGCNSHSGKSCIGVAPCHPYTTPRLPVSTFYQYWRTNACNVNVWDGFRNRCHTTIDLSIKKKSLCGGCDSGCGHVYQAVDCGPQPAEWCDAPCEASCDQAPGCDG